MFKDKSCHGDSLFISLQNDMKEAIKKASNNDLEKHENDAIQMGDEKSLALIEEIKLNNLVTTKDNNAIITILKTAIKNKSMDIIKYAIERTQINNEIASLISQLDDKNIIDLLVSKRELENKDEAVNEALSLEKNHYYYPFKTNTYYAFKILEKYRDYFSQKNDKAHFDNYPDFKDRECFFNSTSCLKRHYNSIVYENNFKALIAKILSQLLNVYNTNYYANELLNNLIENRKLFAIKDDYIVQYLIEGNYDFKDFIDENIKNKFKNIVYTLIKNHVDFSSDKLGFLIQIAAMTELDEMIEPIVIQGSNANGFLKRYNDKQQWLNQQEQQELEETDCNYDRSYDIYKKFDEENSLSEFDLKKLSTMLNYQNLDKEMCNNKVDEIKSKI